MEIASSSEITEFIQSLQQITNHLNEAKSFEDGIESYLFLQELTSSADIYTSNFPNEQLSSLTKFSRVKMKEFGNKFFN